MSEEELKDWIKAHVEATNARLDALEKRNEWVVSTYEKNRPAPEKPAGGVRVHQRQGVIFFCEEEADLCHEQSIHGTFYPDPPSGREEKVGTPKDYDPNPQYAPPPPRVAQERCAKCGSPRVSLDHQNSMGHAFVPAVKP